MYVLAIDPPQHRSASVARCTQRLSLKDHANVVNPGIPIPDCECDFEITSAIFDP